MSEARKHTPGPWAYHSWKAAGTRYGIETADHRHGIASIHPNETASSLLPLGEHEANARLIAAAPELLAVCEALAVRGAVIATTGLGEQLEAAIRKATGNAV